MARKKKTIVEIYDKDLGTVTTKDMKGKVLAVSHAAKEAQASCSLDGSTQSCPACQREHVTVRLDGRRLDEVVGYGFFHLEDNGGSWFLELGDLTMSLTSKKAVPVDAVEFKAGTVFKQEVEHVCGQRPMTVAERELVEAALRRDMFAVMDATEKVRAERKEKT